MEKEIRLIRLTSGEEILVKILKENDISTTVENPILLIPNKDAIGFMPYMSYCDIDNGLGIRNEDIMFNLKPTKELINNYNNMTSNVVTPLKPKIVT
jgi:hypothetical protein